jgi:hypothetical protein
VVFEDEKEDGMEPEVEIESAAREQPSRCVPDGSIVRFSFMGSPKIRRGEFCNPRSQNCGGPVAENR